MAIDKVIEIIKNTVGGGVTVTESSELFNDLGLSSLDMITLIGDLEQELNVNIKIVDLIGVATVGDLANVLQKYVAD